MTTLQPTQFGDGGPGSGSLRDLILQANASGEDTVIELQSGGVFTLSIANGPGTLGEIDDENAGLTGDLDVVNFGSDATLTIRGLGEGATIDAGGVDRVFDVVSDTVLNDGFVTYGSQLVLENVTIAGGSAGGAGFFDQNFAGGGIRVQSQSTLDISNSTIAGNTAVSNNGGGLANTGGLATLDNVAITGNVAFGGESSPGDGGGLFSQYGITIVENSTISGNTAAGSGGGLSHVEGGTLTIVNSTIENNSAAFAGGGVGNNDPLINEGILDITESTITGNTAARGGGIYSSGAGSVSGSTIIANNVATASGGGISTDGTPEGDSARFSIADSVVRNNTAPTGGGVFVGFSGSRVVEVANSTIELNTATNADGFGGGGIGGDSGILFLYSSAVRENTSAAGGGGIGLTTAASIANSTIANNSAAGSGGGIATFGNSRIAFSTISGNTAGEGGGGFFAGPGAFETYFTDIANSTIANNSADGNGGGIQVAGGIVNGTVAYTVGGTYYGFEDVAAFPTDATVINSTIVGNVADADNSGDDNGGGIFVPPFVQVGFDAFLPGEVILQNSIVSGNSDTPDNAGAGTIAPDVLGPVRGSNNLLSSADGIYQVILAPEATIGGPSDIVTLDAGLGPLADNGGDTQTIALLPGSPAIDAGNNGAIAPDFFDADNDGDAEEPNPFEQRFTSAQTSGLPRIVGAAVDIGAFELGNTPTDPTDPPDPSPGNAPPTVAGEATASVPENTFGSIEVAAADPDGDSLEFSLSGGADLALFFLDPVAGLLTFLDAPDFEAPSDANGDNLFEVEVAVTDGTNEPVVQALTVAVTDDPADNPADNGPIDPPDPTDPMAPSPDGILDSDGNGNIEPLTDGLNVLRVLLGAPVESIVLGTGAPDGTTRETVAESIEAAGEALDVDRNGNIEPLTDGLNVLRVLLGAPLQSIVLGAGVPDGTTQETVVDNTNALF